MLFTTKYENYERIKNEFTDVIFLNFADKIPEEVNIKDENFLDWGIFAPRKSLIKNLMEDKISLNDFYITYNRDLEKL